LLPLSILNSTFIEWMLLNKDSMSFLTVCFFNPSKCSGCYTHYLFEHPTLCTLSRQQVCFRGSQNKQQLSPYIT
jgi:hypothetical protein